MLRVDLGMSKAELARRVNRNASSVRPCSLPARSGRSSRFSWRWPMRSVLSCGAFPGHRSAPRDGRTGPSTARRSYWLAVADYGRLHPLGNTAVSGAQPARPGPRRAAAAVGGRLLPGTRWHGAPRWSSPTPARTLSTRSSRRCWTRSPRRRLHGSPAGQMGSYGRVDGRLVREIRWAGSERGWQAHIPRNRGEPPVPAGAQARSGGGHLRLELTG